MSNDFEHGLFGCFDNCGLSIITFLFPCYTFGKVAESVGDSCCLCGLMIFVPVVGFISMLSVRGKVRDTKDIDGSCVGDCLKIILCPFCALVQEAQEVQGVGGQYMTRD